MFIMRIFFIVEHYSEVILHYSMYLENKKMSYTVLDGSTMQRLTFLV